MIARFARFETLRARDAFLAGVERERPDISVDSASAHLPHLVFRDLTSEQEDWLHARAGSEATWFSDHRFDRAR